MRRPLPAWVASGVLAQYVYPAYYGDLINGGGLVVALVLAARNALLVVATVLAVRAVWRVSR